MIKHRRRQNPRGNVFADLGLPSTRTLARFAKATGHRLKIGFEPVKERRAR